MDAASMIPNWVGEIRRRTDRASPAPWSVGSANDEAFMSAKFVATQEVPSNGWPPESAVVAITSLQMPRYAGNERADENSEFIAAARHDVPRLCDALEEAIGRCADLGNAIRDLLATARMPRNSIERSEATRRGQRLIASLGGDGR